MEVLPKFIKQKRELAKLYAEFFYSSDFELFIEPEYAKSNYWLNSVLCPDTNSRNLLLKRTNEKGVMTRPIWQLMHRMPAFSKALKGNLTVSEWAEAHLVNLPSSPTKLVTQ